MTAVGVMRTLFGVVILAGAIGEQRASVRGRRQLGQTSTISCSVVNERSDTIIQTKQSLAGGAVFLVAPDVASQDDCLSACCNTLSCNTAVAKWKACAFYYDMRLFAAIGRLTNKPR